MATYKGTMIFNQGRAGWSESWYLQASNHDEALDKMSKSGPSRMKLLGGGASIEYIRVSDVAILGDSFVEVVSEWALSTGVTGADEPWDAVYVRVEAGALYRRQMWLRGIPDAWAGPAGSLPGTNPNNPFLKEYLDKFKARAKAVPFQLRCIEKEGAGAVKTPITSLTANAQDQIVFGLATPQGNVGDEFRVVEYDGPDKKLLNRVYKIVAVGAGTVTTSAKFSALSAPNENAGGKAKPRIIVYKNVTDIIPLRMAKRSTGRAFFLPVGRR